MIIEWPLNDLFNDGCDVIILSQMAVINLIGKKSRNIILTENDNLEMTVSENSRLKVVINGRSLLSFRNNGDEKTGLKILLTG